MQVRDGNHQWTVGITESCTVIDSFATHDEAAEFISTLARADEGIYYIDGPNEETE